MAGNQNSKKQKNRFTATLKRLKDNIPFRKKSKFTRDCLHKPGFQIGDFSYGCPRVIEFGEGAALTIGKFCSISTHVRIFLGGNHRADWITTYPFKAFPDHWPQAAASIGKQVVSKGDVCIGNDVWIGYGVTILSGVTIGDGVIIGAKSVVTKDVPPYTIAAGNPCRVRKKRFDDETICRLLDVKWWDWPADKIQRHVASLCSGNIDRFLDSL